MADYADRWSVAAVVAVFSCFSFRGNFLCKPAAFAFRRRLTDRWQLDTCGSSFFEAAAAAT